MGPDRVKTGFLAIGREKLGKDRQKGRSEPTISLMGPLGKKLGLLQKNS